MPQTNPKEPYVNPRNRVLLLKLVLIQMNPVHAIILLKSVLILSFRLRLVLPSSLFPSCFFTRIIYAFLFTPVYATCPAHSTFLDFIPRIMLGTNILLSRLVPFAEEIMGGRGVINVDSDAIGQLLITSAVFVKYLRKNGNTMRQCISSL